MIQGKRCTHPLATNFDEMQPALDYVQNYGFFFLELIKKISRVITSKAVEP